MNRAIEQEVAEHYHQPDLLNAIIDGLRQSGANPDAPSLEELAPVDEFHTAGRATTLTAIEMTPITPGMNVLDAGCGIGGTARYLAKEKECNVTGIDLTKAYVDVATALSIRTGLADNCDFHTGSVLNLPFEDQTYDAAVSFHVAMNIEDRSQFYFELARVMKEGAPLCIFDVMKGANNGLKYPVPWAEKETCSFLKTPDETAVLLKQQGFKITSQKSLRDFAMKFFHEVFATAAKQNSPAPLGLHLLTGDNAAEKFKNYAEGLDMCQIDPMIIVAKRI